MQHSPTVLPVEIRTRKLYGKFLSAWAIDLMALRRQGLATPSSREADDSLVLPADASPRPTFWASDNPTHLLTWRPSIQHHRAAA